MNRISTRTTARALALTLVLPLSVTLFAGAALADENPYAPTSTVGSGNGNGGGKALGKPLAGTVGRADDKNPKGQAFGPGLNGDMNNGYECDGNSGIARSNPAHTSCVVFAPID